MSNREHIEKRIQQAAELTLSRQHYVSVVDIFLGVGWLQPVHVLEWRKGKISCLEEVIQVNSNKISYAMECFRQWAVEKELLTSETVYLRKTSGPKQELQFSKSAASSIEKLYRTHYVSPRLS